MAASFKTTMGLGGFSHEMASTELHWPTPLTPVERSREVGDCSTRGSSNASRDMSPVSPLAGSICDQDVVLLPGPSAPKSNGLRLVSLP